MRLLLRLLLSFFFALALAVAAGSYWLFFYSGDLPSITSMQQFAPDAETQATNLCSGTMSTAIPYSSIGDNLRAALSAAETSRNDPGVLANLSERIRGDQQLPRVPASVQIARMILCVPSHALSRETKELRLAIRLERHYTRQQLFTIYANMAPFGQNLLGVQEASQTIFHKDSRELTLAQAALLAGLMRAPSYYSPFKHADRALQRRNEVIDAMVANERITQSDGVRAKASSLDVAARDTSPTK